MPRNESVLYTFTYKFRLWARVAREAGVDIDRFLASKGVTEKQLLEPSRRIPRQQASELLYELVELIGDPEIGLRLAASSELADADLLGYLIRNCPHLLAAMQELSTYSRLISDVAQFEVETDLDKVAFVMGATSARKIDPVEIDIFMGAICRIIHKFSEGKINPLEVHLARPRPLHPESYREFFNASVTFDAERCVIYYTKSALHTPIQGSDPRLRELLQQRADALLEDLPAPNSLLEQVRDHVARQIERGQEFSVEMTARKLGMSERTFARRLREAGYRYRELTEEVRRDQALDLAHNSNANVTAIAYRVGFADTTTFARAFRRWTGLSPIEYLKKVRSNGADAALK